VGAHAIACRCHTILKPFLNARAEVIEICGSMPVLARLLGGWLKERRPAELRRQIVAKVPRRHARGIVSFAAQ
jgi:hypothetical protein